MDVDAWIARLRRCELLNEREVKQLCDAVIEILIEEANVQRVDSPVTICGDIHGQFYDLLELFSVGGDCPKTSYLFMGDFVDRGFYSVETFLLLLSLKLRYPDRVTLIRGTLNEVAFSVGRGLGCTVVVFLYCRSLVHVAASLHSARCLLVGLLVCLLVCFLACFPAHSPASSFPRVIL